MQIGIDVTSLTYQRGVSRYTANLVRALTASSHHLHLYGYAGRGHSQLSDLTQLVAGNQPNVTITIQRIPPSVQSWLWQFGLNKVATTLPQIDVFHSWDWLQPPDKNLPLVTTIHDLALLKFPETAHPKIAAMHQRAWNVLKKRPAAQIIAVSHATKKDIVSLLEIEPNRVHVVYEALPTETISSMDTLTEERIDQIRTKLHLTTPFLLFVGTREPRKNVLKLIEAWQPLASEYDLLIAGDTGWDLSADHGFKHQPRFLGRVSDSELAVLYEHAAIFVYPSLYEGFGLPILEAFSHGTPVVTSNLSSMPEVAGNAAELVDPHSADSIQAGITTILNETKTEAQTRLKKMILRLHLFDWQTVATQTLTVYNQAITTYRELT